MRNPIWRIMRLVVAPLYRCGYTRRKFDYFGQPTLERIPAPAFINAAAANKNLINACEIISERAARRHGRFLFVRSRQFCRCPMRRASDIWVDSCIIPVYIDRYIYMNVHSLLSPRDDKHSGDAETLERCNQLASRDPKSPPYIYIYTGFPVFLWSPTGIDCIIYWPKS